MLSSLNLFECKGGLLMGVPVELRISSSIDLMYHGLAHLPLHNPANLYSKDCRNAHRESSG